MKAANSNGATGSVWHIYPYRGKNVQSLCERKTIKNVGTRKWIHAEESSQVEKMIQNKFGNLCKNCKHVMKKRKSVHRE